MSHSVHLKAPPPTRGLSLTAAPSHHRAALSPATPPSVSQIAKQVPVPDRAVLKADWAIRGACRRFCSPLLARLLSDENYALILDLLDWKKLLVRLIVYFPNGYCRRRCGTRDGNFRPGLANSRDQPKTYRHRGEPGDNAYDCASH